MPAQHGSPSALDLLQPQKRGGRPELGGLFGSPAPQPMAMGGLFSLGGLAGSPGGRHSELAYMLPQGSVPGVPGAMPPQMQEPRLNGLPRGPLGGWLEKSGSGPSHYLGSGMGRWSNHTLRA
jgi:hypothetical protein